MSLLYPFYRNATHFVSRQWSSIYFGKKIQLGRGYTCMRIIQDAAFSRAGSKGVSGKQSTEALLVGDPFLKSSSNHGKWNEMKETRNPSLRTQESSTWFAQAFKEWKHHFRRQQTSEECRFICVPGQGAGSRHKGKTPVCHLPLSLQGPLLCRL